MEESSEDSSDEEEAPAPAKPAAAAAKKAEAMEESSDDDSSDEEEPAKPAPKPAAVATKKEESSSDDSSDEDEKPAADAAKPATKPAAPATKKDDSSSDDSSDDEEPAVPPKPAVKTPVKTPVKTAESSDDDSSDDEEEAPKQTSTPAVKKTAEDEDSSDDDSSDDEEEVKKPVVEEEPPMKMKSNKNKTLEEVKTPQKEQNQSFGGDSEVGRKIFIHNFGEDFEYNVLEGKVEKFGEVTDFYNSGRGFAFLTFSTKEEAEACIAGMDNTDVGGKTVQMNIAKPKGEKGGGKGGRQEPAEGCKLFVHGIQQEVMNNDLQSAFAEYGTVTDAFNPGKGFAFVTFSTPKEAKAAMEALEGTEVCGCQVSVSVAKPKGGAATPRGGGGAGRGGRRQDVEGTKLFVHNVSEETSQDDLYSAFGAHGTVTDAYNPGRGFAFITYSSPAEANAAIAAMEGQEVCGREIQCNIAKPKGDAGGGRGGGRGGARGGARGGRGGRGGGGRGGRGGRGGLSINVGGGGGNKKTSFD